MALGSSTGPGSTSGAESAGRLQLELDPPFRSGPIAAHVRKLRAQGDPLPLQFGRINPAVATSAERTEVLLRQRHIFLEVELVWIFHALLQTEITAESEDFLLSLLDNRLWYVIITCPAVVGFYAPTLRLATMHQSTRLILSLALVVLAAFPAAARDECAPSARSNTMDELVAKIQSENLRYVFVGEQHDVGPVKRFAVDLVNGLAASGTEVGLYVEGFRTNCPPGDRSCLSLADAFNFDAFQLLLNESSAPVHAIDPPEHDLRTERMAATISEGSEAVRVVLVGKSHVIYAGDPDAELWVFGGGMSFPDPGDLAEAFPASQVLTIGLETSRDQEPPYSLHESGCGLDLVVTTHPTTDYWGAPKDGTSVKNVAQLRSTIGTGTRSPDAETERDTAAAATSRR